MSTPARCLEPSARWLPPPAPCAPCWASTRAQLRTASPPSLPHTAFLQQIHWGPLRALCSPSLALGRAGTGGTALCFSAEILLCGPLQQCFVQQLPAITRLQLIQINEKSQPQQSEQKPD